MKSLVFVVLACVLIAVLSSGGVPSQHFSLQLVSDANGNECLVMAGTLGHTRDSLFMVDTAYAGAPVISTSYLSVSPRVRGSVAERYVTSMEMLKQPQSNDDRHLALRGLLGEGRCRSYTSGCTQRLMGIGVTNESQSDMLLCPSIVWDHKRLGSTVDADVFMTHPLKGGIHILTSDYLLHRAPCLLMPRFGRIQFHAHEAIHARGFEFHPAEMVGGAFVVPLTIGSTTLRVVVDTGAAAALSLAPSALKKVQLTPRHKKAFQSGVNEERVCSDVHEAVVSVGTLRPGTVEVFANSHEVHGCDGYAGMGMLRAFDLWLQPDKIGFRLNGLAPRESLLTIEGSC